MAWQALILDSQNTLIWILKQAQFQVAWSENYFWGLTLLSLIIAILEIIFPWRKEQRFFREDFWLDIVYMYLNFFGFTVILEGLYAAISSIATSYHLSLKELAFLSLKGEPIWLQLLIFFVVADFLQWGTHQLLHRIPFLWRFHKVHHSVREMGFAAHLRYHWVENLLYKPAKMLVLLLFGGVEPSFVFIIHFFAICIGHLNHSNLRISWGIFGYILNSPCMHLYHHQKDLPEEHSKGVNFAISLSIWDYIFGTNYFPKIDPDLILGFEGDEQFPRRLWAQLWVGFRGD